MTARNGLTKEEAEQFLELLEVVERDLEQAFTDASRDIFGEGCEYDSFEEKWGGQPSEIFVAGSRKKYRRFVELAYLGVASDDEE